MAFGWDDAIFTGLGVLKGIFGNKGSKQIQDTRQDQYTDITNETLYDPQARALKDKLINAYLFSLENNDDFFSGYQKQGLSTILGDADTASSGINNMLASRGIRGPAAGYASIIPRMNAMNQSSTFRNSIPLLADQYQRQKMGEASEFLSSLPLSKRTFGNTTTTGHNVQTQPGQPGAGGISTLATTLAGLLGNNDWFGGGSGSGSGGKMSGVNNGYGY